MRALVQRVSSASVAVEGRDTRSIGRGIVVLLGVAVGDKPEDAVTLADKLLSLRLFPTKWAFEKIGAPKSILKQALSDPKPSAAFDLTLSDIGGDVLVVSQFTLFADVKKGRKPDFTRAAKSDVAVALYRSFVDAVEKRLLTPSADPRPKIATGDFGASMQVSLVNEGPATFLLDTTDFKPKR
jgi:D-tyrosyl-tRNA(Tyr) deacylase